MEMKSWTDSVWRRWLRQEGDSEEGGEVWWEAAGTGEDSRGEEEAGGDRDAAGTTTTPAEGHRGHLAAAQTTFIGH